MTTGGNVVLLGRLPERDLDGSPCTVLADALGLTAGGVVRDTGHYYPSLVAHGWAHPWPEMRAGWVQALRHERGDVVLTDVYGAVCGVDVPLGQGRAIVLAAQVPSDAVLFDRALSSLGVSPGLRLETQWPGVFATTTRSEDGQRALHVINISGSPATVTVAIDGTPIAAGNTLHVPPRSGHILPLASTWPAAGSTGPPPRSPASTPTARSASAPALTNTAAQPSWSTAPSWFSQRKSPRFVPEGPDEENGRGATISCGPAVPSALCPAITSPSRPQ